MNQRSVETFPVYSVKDEKLPDVIPGFAPGVAYIRSLLDNCPFAYTLPKARESLEFNGSEQDSDTPTWQLHQISQNHARSLEVLDPVLPEIWSDEHGNTYSSLNLKGNTFYGARLMAASTDSSRLVAYGLQESNVIERVIKASRLMREAGIGTEYILGLAEPKQYSLPTVDHLTDHHQMVPLSIYKDILVHRRWSSLPEAEQTAEKLVELRQSTARMTFYVSARAMDTSLRVGEFAVNTDNRAKLYDHVNKQYLPEGEAPFDPDERLDSKRLLARVTAPRLGRNMARMHSLGLAHGFAGKMNLTALGSIVDLDSVHGEALGYNDEPITIKDVFHDILEVMLALAGSEDALIRILSTKGEIDELAAEVFLSHYAAEYRPGQITLESIAKQALRHSRTASSVADDFVGLSQRAAALRILDRFKGSEELPDMKELEASIANWAERNQPALHTAGLDVIERMVDELADSLFEDYINELRIGTYKHPLEAIYGDGQINGGSLAVAQLVEELEVVYRELYLAAQPKDLDEEAITDLDDQLGRDTFALQKLAYKQMGEALLAKKAWLYEHVNMPSAKTILSGDHTPEVMFTNEGGRFLYETDNVELSELTAACSTRLEQIQAVSVTAFINNHLRSDDDEAKLGPNDFALTDKANQLTELITDGCIDGMQSSGSRLEVIEVSELNDASYVACIEETTAGNIILQLKLVGLEPEDFAHATDQPTIARLLENLGDLRRQQTLPMEIAGMGTFTELPLDEPMRKSKTFLSQIFVKP